MEWGIENTFKIIALYRQFPCLWEYRNSDYKRTDMKRNAWEEIAKQMNKSVEDVKKKIKYLRSAYVGEKKKAENSKLSGSSADDVYRPHLFYFQEFSFLDSVVVLRNTSSNLSKRPSGEATVEVSHDLFAIDDDCIEQIEDSTQNTIASHSMQTPKRNGAKKMKMERDNKFNSAVDLILHKVNNINTDDNEFTSFSRSIALQLSRLPFHVAADLMGDMQKMIALKIKKHTKTDLLEDAMFDADII